MVGSVSRGSLSGQACTMKWPHNSASARRCEAMPCETHSLEESESLGAKSLPAGAGPATQENMILIVRGAVPGVAIRCGHNSPDGYGKRAGTGKTRRRHLRANPLTVKVLIVRCVLFSACGTTRVSGYHQNARQYNGRRNPTTQTIGFSAKEFCP